MLSIDLWNHLRSAIFKVLEDVMEGSLSLGCLLNNARLDDTIKVMLGRYKSEKIKNKKLYEMV